MKIDLADELIEKELLRKSIHFLSLGYIPLYLTFGKSITLTVVLSLTAFALILELVRRKFQVLPKLLLRDYEAKGLAAYVYFGISASIVTIIFPMEACIVAIVVGSLGDGVAGIFKSSSLQGYSSIAMLIASFSFLLFLTCCADLLLFSALIACVAGVLAERIQKIGKYYINDNLSVSIVSALTYHLSICFFYYFKLST
ncbi:hypothetical protein DRP05_06380 [Archaeoglobales archaeon]|nr:MAG: hypothetical protein DRP05_06380 [Archaeoglobales archaeon]